MIEKVEKVTIEICQKLKQRKWNRVSAVERMKQKYLLKCLNNLNSNHFVRKRAEDEH